MTRLIVTADAEADTFEILQYLESKAGAAVAERYAKRFRTTVERLIELPQSGAPHPALGPDARCVVIPPFVVIYDYIQSDKTLILLRILHGRSHITKAARQRS